ncbi:MAG TPA: hypothetical protein VMH84_12460 [Xanthobacteraceae bacterium]|nr:hypothetical protein [Xanthobacteraceae bacterium]
MTSSAQYRRYAADCVRVAQTIHDPADKAMLLQMAKIWIDLAEKAEKKPPENNSDYTSNA